MEESWEEFEYRLDVLGTLVGITSLWWGGGFQWCVDCVYSMPTEWFIRKGSIVELLHNDSIESS